jgi:hypothetical protein
MLRDGRPRIIRRLLRPGMTVPASFPVVAVKEYANRDWARRHSLDEASGLNDFGGRPGAVHVSVAGVVLQEFQRIEERLRSD